MRFNAISTVPRSDRRSSRLSLSEDRHRYDISTVDTWNEVRKIGAEGRRLKVDEDSKDEKKDLTIDEVQDWDYYIALFNKQYRDQQGYSDDESIESLAYTKSELLQDRQRRTVVWRVFFILGCLAQCCVSIWAAVEWYMTYEVLPMGFLKHIGLSISSRFFTPDAKWFALAAYIHSWLIASYGFLCAFCFQHKLGLLKQYILRIPFALLFPSILIFISVRYIGELEARRLATAMAKLIPSYYNLNVKSGYKTHDIADAEITEATMLWDKLQRHLLCCGVYGPQDWEYLEVVEELTLIPPSCCPRAYGRKAYRVLRRTKPKKDSCREVNIAYKTSDYEWVYPDGCLTYAHELFVQRGARVVLLMGVNLLFMFLCLAFGYKYYETIRKVNELKFKYSVRDWFMEIFCIAKCTCLCVKRNNRRNRKIQPMYSTEPVDGYFDDYTSDKPRASKVSFSSFDSYSSYASSAYQLDSKV